MTSSDFDTFLAEFKRLSMALDPYKKTALDISAKADAYFHVLKKYPIATVIAKADAWIAVESKFPKPAEWAGQMVPVVAPPLPVLSTSQAEDYLRAERLCYEDAPCGCEDCRRAGVEEKRLRFVPEFTTHDTDRKVRCGDRIVTAGHWAHGAELAGVYRARADFWNRAVELGLLTKTAVQRGEKLSLEERLAQIFRKREMVTR